MENKEKVFLLWGQDAEMQQIKKKLEKYWIPHIDKNLWWRASVKDYENEITREELSIKKSHINTLLKYNLSAKIVTNKKEKCNPAHADYGFVIQ